MDNDQRQVYDTILGNDKLSVDIGSRDYNEDRCDYYLDIVVKMVFVLLMSMSITILVLSIMHAIYSMYD